MEPIRSIAYFSMEVALEPGMPTYSGGLGVLAGDTLRSAADLQVPMVAVTLLHRQGYFRQQLDAGGRQLEQPENWRPDQFLRETPERARLTLEGRNVEIRAWRYDVKGLSGFVVPVYLLDSDLEENSAGDRTLTDHLYGKDSHYRLCQEAILGIGGVRMLRASGYQQIERFHMNEGHSSLLTLELLDEQARLAGRTSIEHEDIEPVRRTCVFTTHTPVASGHDRFPKDLVLRVLGRREVYDMEDVFCCEGELNMTYLALNLSHYVNGVAKKHRETSQLMFAAYNIDSITNGVHLATWTCPSIQALLDRRIAGWREDNFSLRYALNIPAEEILDAHQQAKSELLERVLEMTGVRMDPQVFTIGFARRATSYKRPDLLIHDLEKLRSVESAGPFQVIYAGKAHPADQPGRQLIQRIFQAINDLKGEIEIVYLPNYDIELGRLITAGVDVWLNTPRAPMEASGTSGMKAAVNGVPSLSVLDGWWLEGCIEGITGWSIGDPAGSGSDAAAAASLYSTLQNKVVPLFYGQPQRFLEIRLHCIALNGAFFHTQRMLQQYVVKAYYE